MLLNPETLEIQRKFTQYCRTGQLKSIPGADSQRIEQYRRLTWNIIDGTLQGSYPLTHDILSEKEWEDLVQDFFSTWDLHNPEIWRMPKQLYEFVLSLNYAQKLMKPYLNDLLLFEWLEVEVFMMADRPAPINKKQGDIWKDQIVLNPEHFLTKFDYPVFRSAAADLEAQKGTYFLVSFRHPETLEASFMEVSAFYMRALEVLSEVCVSGSDLLEHIASEFGLQLTDQLKQGFEEFLNSLRKAGMILGYR